MKLAAAAAIGAAILPLSAETETATPWEPSDSAFGTTKSETVITNETVVNSSALDIPFLATTNIFIIGKGGVLTNYGPMTIGYGHTVTSYNVAATNVFTIIDGGRLVITNRVDENGTVEPGNFYFGSVNIPKRRSLVTISGEGTIADFRYVTNTFFYGNTSVAIADGATVYLGPESGFGNHSSVASNNRYETQMTISGEKTAIYLSNQSKAAALSFPSKVSAYVTNHVVMSGGRIEPLLPSGTFATSLSLKHGVFEMRGGSIDLYVPGNTNPDVNCNISIGPKNNEFKMSGGTITCGDFCFGVTNSEMSERIQRLYMTGGKLSCRRLYLGTSNASTAPQFAMQSAYVDLDGGVLELRQIFRNSASADYAKGYLTANGGTVRAIKNGNSFFDQIFKTAQVGPKGLTIDNDRYALTVKQVFTNKARENGEAEDGCLVFTGSGTTTYNPGDGYAVSRTIVKEGTLLFSGDETLATELIITNGATVTLEGSAQILTIDKLTVPKGTIILDPGDTIHLTGTEIDLSGLTVKFTDTATADSVYSIFTFDDDVSSNATLIDALRFLALGNAVSGRHAAFSLVHDETSGKTTVQSTYREEIPALSDATVWNGPVWNGGWSAGAPTDKVAVFSNGEAPAEIAVPDAAEVGAFSFTTDKNFIFAGGKLDFTPVKGGAWFDMTSGRAVFNLPVGMYWTLPLSLAAGTALTFNEPLVGGGIEKTGTGALTLAADNRLRYAVSLGGGLNTIASAGALNNLENKAVFTDDTLAFTNSVDDSEMVIATPIVIESATSKTNAVVLKADGDVLLKNLSVEAGAIIKRGAGKLTVEASATESTNLQSGYGPLSASNYRVMTETLVEFAEDGTAPAPSGRQYAGFNIAEGEMVIKGEPDVSRQVDLVTGCCIGMNVAGDPAEFVQPVLTVDGADVNTYGQGHTTIGAGKCGACAVCAPVLRVLNGGKYHAGNIRLGNGTSSAGAYPTLAVTNASATAANAIRFEVTGGIGDRGAIVRAKNSIVAVTGTGSGHHGIFISGTVDADFDNCFVGGTKQLGILLAEKPSAGTLRFRNGGVLNAFPKNNQASADYDLTMIFDDAEWNWGNEDKTLSYVNSLGEGLYTLKRFVEMEGVGVILKPAAGVTYTTEVEFSGTGGCVCAGEGTVKFTGDTLRFTGLLDIRSGTVDLSETDSRAELTVRGPGTLKGGRITKLVISQDATGAEAPVLDGVVAEKVVVDFGADAAKPVAKGESVLIARYGETAPTIGKWRVKGTGLRYPHANITFGDGEVRAKVTESMTLIVR